MPARNASTTAFAGPVAKIPGHHRRLGQVREVQHHASPLQQRALPAGPQHRCPGHLEDHREGVLRPRRLIEQQHTPVGDQQVDHGVAAGGGDQSSGPRPGVTPCGDTADHPIHDTRVDVRPEEYAVDHPLPGGAIPGRLA
ncbi:MAG: hypothetical protein ACRDUA_02055 [Micromonosporaceae bacterium]